MSGAPGPDHDPVASCGRPARAGTCARTGPSRRRLLGTGGLVAAGSVVVAACGGAGPSGQGGEPQDEPDGALRVARSDTPVRSSTYYPGRGRGVVVTHPAEDTWHAYDATCPHQGCSTSGSDDDGNLVCPCHGSVFDPGTGEPVSGPAEEPLTSLPVEVDGEDLLIRG